MKIKPKHPESFESYAHEHGFNPEEYIGFNSSFIFPKDYKTRLKYSESYNATDEFDNDLYDNQIELETRKNNSQEPHTKIQDMTPKEKAAYLQALLDIESESLT